MTPKKIPKVAKNWHFQNQNKPIWPHRQICLSKVTQSALIGHKRKQTEGNSCFSCSFSVSSNKQQNHVAKHDVIKKSISKSAPKCVKPLFTEVSHKYELPVKSCKSRNDFYNPTGDKSSLTLSTSDKNQSWFPPGTKVRYHTKICSLVTNKNVGSPKTLALTGQNMTRTNDNSGNDGEKSQKRGHKDLLKKSKSSKKESSSDKSGAVGSETQKAKLPDVTKNAIKQPSAKILRNEEKQKHLSAIQSIVSKTLAKNKEKNNPQKAIPAVSQPEVPKTPEKKGTKSAGPAAPQSTSPGSPERIDTSDISPVKGTPFFKFTDSPTKTKQTDSERGSESPVPHKRSTPVKISITKRKRTESDNGSES